MSWETSPLAFLNQLLGVQERDALVTGGASGIGLAAVELFTAAGMNVCVLDFNEVDGPLHVDRINACGYPGKCKFFKLDVTSRDACQTVVAEIAGQNGGRIDVLFNCAGLSVRDAQLPDQTARDRLWNVNVHGTDNMCETVLPYMKESGFGRIINMGSAVGFAHIAFPLGLLYKRSKVWVHARTLELALQYATNGITVNALAPGRVLTPLVTLPGKGWVALAPDPVEAFRTGCSTQASGTMLKTGEVAMMALNLCSPWMANVTGTIIDMTSGWATAGHQAYPADKMPAAFDPFRIWAQTTTPTKIVPDATI